MTTHFNSSIIYKFFKQKNMKLKIANKSKNEMPTYANPGDAGFDLRANLENPVTIKPGEWKLIPTGLFMKIPDGMEGQIRSRSGMSLKKGLTVLNSPGTIDSSYIGHVQVILINQSQEEQVVEHGERIAQMVFAKHEVAEIEVVSSEEQLGKTERGTGGFGSTGSH